MSRFCKYGLLMLLLIASAANNSGAQQGRAQVLWEDYKVVVERNIFARDRGKRPTTTAAEPTMSPPPRPERYFLLTGIVQQGEEGIAFFEDTRTGTTSRIRAGESIAGGRLANITLDYVEYESDGQTVRIKVGKNLEGSLTAPAVPYEFFESAGPLEVPESGTSGELGAVDNDAAGILERLRQRRQRELER